MLEKIISMFQQPFATITNHGILIHKDYTQITPTNYRPPLARSVINQNIQDKDDFINFVKEYATPLTKIFFNTESIKAIFNYTGAKEANYGDSYCKLVLTKTSEFIHFESVLDIELKQRPLIMMLKRLEPYITHLDGKKADDMDIIEIAEHLHASKNVNSIVRNTQQSFVLDAEVRAGNSSFTIPRYITFNMPIYKNDLTLKCDFEVELFLSADEAGFSAMLRCYKLDQIVDEATNTLTQDIVSNCKEIKSFRV